MDKILVIDDSHVQSQMLEQLLRDEYTVKVLHESTIALETASHWNPSLILLDVIMPVIDGFQLLTELKKEESTKDIPVILITSLSDIGNEETGLKLGAVDYITKPFSTSIIKARIHTHIQLYSYRKMIENLAMMDELTGIPNRRAFEERIKITWRKAQCGHFPLSIAMLDIDFFKQYNDTCGHPAGDKALKALASILSSRVKAEGGFAARYGGEEFILLLPGLSVQDGYRLCDSIRRDIEDSRISHPSPDSFGYLTVSIGGMTVLPGAKEASDVCISLADHMLYQAKNSGRNMVFWNKEVIEG